MVFVCIAEAILHFENTPAAIAWAIASAGWMPHVFVNRLTKEDITCENN